MTHRDPYPNAGTSSGMLSEDVVNTVTALLSRLEVRMMEAMIRG